MMFISHTFGKLVSSLVHFVVVSSHSLHFLPHFENLLMSHITIILLSISHFVNGHRCLMELLGVVSRSFGGCVGVLDLYFKIGNQVLQLLLLELQIGDLSIEHIKLLSAFVQLVCKSIPLLNTLGQS